ncbi:MAG: hypothetical protein DRH32_02745 [Deltaproteobacteria bacterium]|nr:MAG: hypothetical protein DRH32_02745 [Deltaproteobacteria bacterium]
MRGAFFIVILIALLVAGFLVVKDISTESNNGATRIDTIKNAKETARQVEEKTSRMSERLKNATKKLQTSY